MNLLEYMLHHGGMMAHVFAEGYRAGLADRKTGYWLHTVVNLPLEPAYLAAYMRGYAKGWKEQNT